MSAEVTQEWTANANQSPRKRARTDEACARRRTRTKLTLTDPSSTSEHSISDDNSALIPTSIGTDSTAPSELDTDSESELSESSEEPSSESSSEEDSDEDSEIKIEDGNENIVNLRANRGKKPTMKLEKDEEGPDIRDFLKDFLPQLKAANEELQREREAGTLKDKEIDAAADGDDQYIEMNLGLGVLEERDPNAKSSSESDSDSDAEQEPKEKDIMGKLMGRESKREDVGIQEVDKAQDT